MTDKQIANLIAKKYFNAEKYKEFKENNNLKIEKDAKKIISIIQEDFNISKTDMENYLDEIKNRKPMPKTQLLVTIIDELGKQGLEWKTREELFHILCPDKEWSEYGDSWHQWLTQHTEDIRKKPILISLQNSLGFESSFWKLPEVKQREKIPAITKSFINKQKIGINNDFKLDGLKPIESNILEEQ